MAEIRGIKMAMNQLSVIVKFYFIDYAITFVPNFPSLLPSTQHPPFLQVISTPLFTSMGHEYMFFGYSISCAVLYMAILFFFLMVHQCLLITFPKIEKLIVN